MLVCKKEYVGKCPPKIVVLRLYNMPKRKKINFKTLNSFRWMLIVFLFLNTNTHAQTKTEEFLIAYHFVDKDSSFKPEGVLLQTTFTNEAEANKYLIKLPELMQAKGYALFSIDSIYKNLKLLHAKLYVGTRFTWLNLSPSGVDLPALEGSGFTLTRFDKKIFKLSEWQILQQRLLTYYENNGYPFASVYLDSVQIINENISALLKVDKAVLYHLDSIRIIGNFKIGKKFLQQYLDIENGSLYNKQILTNVDKKIKELPYATLLQPSDITMLGSGSILNIYANEKKNSQVNFLIGLLPATIATDKLQLTGDVNLNLNNVFARGENILLKWQLLQPKSPRLNLGFSQPYLFNSPFGFNFLFNLFKKDSSFLQLDAQVGTGFQLKNNQKGNLFIQFQNSSLLAGAVDTNVIKFQKKLPQNIDVKAINAGLEYSFNRTDYILNPRRGSILNLKTILGIKNIKPNNDILNIKEAGFDYASLYDSIKPKTYQLRLQSTFAHFIKTGKLSTLKLESDAGIYYSPVIFRNELFQIGGYKLLRGFDEESIYANRYAIFTVEFRQLLSLNSYLYTFVDAGLVQNKWQQQNSNNQFVSMGLGISFETKAGLLNLGLAAGKRNDIKFNIRQAAKIHFGYINYF